MKDEISEMLISVLCNPDGEACIGSDKDNQIINDAIADIIELEAEHEKERTQSEKIEEDLRKAYN